jgi:Uncharacterized protein conserved in bacteria (DUF2188)
MQMNTRKSFEADQDPQVDRVRDALGAIAAASPATFWLYPDDDGNWRVRREGAGEEQHFDSHEAASNFMRVEAARCSSYRLFIVAHDGRVREEAFNWTASGWRSRSMAGGR